MHKLRAGVDYGAQRFGRELLGVIKAPALEELDGVFVHIEGVIYLRHLGIFGDDGVDKLASRPVEGVIILILAVCPREVVDAEERDDKHKQQHKGRCVPEHRHELFAQSCAALFLPDFNQRVHAKPRDDGGAGKKLLKAPHEAIHRQQKPEYERELQNPFLVVSHRVQHERHAPDGRGGGRLREIHAKIGVERENAENNRCHSERRQRTEAAEENPRHRREAEKGRGILANRPPRDAVAA